MSNLADFNLSSYTDQEIREMNMRADCYKECREGLGNYEKPNLNPFIPVSYPDDLTEEGKIFFKNIPKCRDKCDEMLRNKKNIDHFDGEIKQSKDLDRIVRTINNISAYIFIIIFLLIILIILFLSQKIILI